MSGFKKIAILVVPLILLGLMLAVVACTGPAGPAGPAGSAGSPGAAGAAGAAGVPGESSGTISGTVANSFGKSPVAGVKITTDPAVTGVIIQTDNSGKYSAKLPIGAYTLNFQKDNYTASKELVNVAAGQTTTKDVVLKASKAVVVDAGKNVEANPGATVNLTVKVDALDGSRVSEIKWTQVSGVPAQISGDSSDKLTVTLANDADYKNFLVKHTKLEDRVEVVPVIPHALLDTETAVFRATVTTSSGKYQAQVSIMAHLPYEFSGGIRNVPVDVAVIVHGKKQNSYSWVLSAPSGSASALDGGIDQNPSFKPDIAGKYTITEQNSKKSIDIFAGTWAGVITGQDSKGLPLAANCTLCHDGKIATDRFTSWRVSGHAEIFTQNINDPNGHWAINCAECHTVGYNPGAKNNGFDEIWAAEGWKVPSHGDKGLWTQILEKYPKTAQLANIQCENCHGPNNSAAHMKSKDGDESRLSVSSDVCGRCHGEPPRHGRFQQWEESGHGNFEAAIVEATVENRAASAGHCGRCHSSQGFMKWYRQEDITKRIQGAKGDMTVAELTVLGLTKDEVQPQTCVTCHSPHNVGTTSGEPNNARVRIVGDTKMLPAGFQATGVGMGALCITCHNTRNLAHNDAAGNAPTSYSAPHTAAQGDVLMGENAYFVQVQARSKHSFIKDTCATCHMELSPPPKAFSFNQAGTNHAFNASMEICKSCHGAYDGGTLQSSVGAREHELGKAMSDYLLKKMGAQVHIKDYTPHTYQGKFYDVKSDDLTIDKSNIVSIEPSEPHGQQGFLIKFKNAVSVTYKPANEASHTVSVKEVEIQLGDFTTDGKTALIATSDPLVKAGWNYFLIEGDGSKGVHNPSFAMDVLNASINALK